MPRTLLSRFMPHLVPRLVPRHWPRALLGVLLPSVCALCGGGCDDVVCAGCTAAYARLPGARCGRCGNPLAQAAHEHRPLSPRRQRTDVACANDAEDAPMCGTCLAR